ncbi:Zn(2)-Cys(6) binuclear cluster domain-containing protein [Mycena olivaceomarginata]|nr:Zn(2)-Cys(6) binuclear cluster domain-containing protein [Mycena olivaceomarginata]
MPICFQCSRYPIAFGDCEYTEDGPSQSQMLEEQISLQTRIEELERPTRGPSSSQPSSSYRQSTSTLQVTPSNTSALGPLLTYFYLQQTSGTSLNEAAANSMPTELPFIVLQALAHNFLQNADGCGFFLDTQAFHDAITTTGGQHLPPVLLNVMYLWGIHLSDDARISAFEPAFLAHALRSTAGSLSGTHPRRILHSLQASVLLAYYFIRNARILEGKYHISVAVSIALSAGLHRIRALQGADTPPVSEMLAPPRDTQDEGERISAFWGVLNLNNCFASRDGTCSNISYGGSTSLVIDTPWPLETTDYVERPHLLPLQSSGTVVNFLRDVPDNATSSSALYAKAGILYEEATRLGGRCRSGGLSPNDPEFTALDRKIDAFTPTLPPIQSQQMLLVHTLSHCATIQLHEPLTNTNVGSRTKTLVAARAVVDIHARTEMIPKPMLGLLEPAVAPLWTTTCLAFIAEIDLQRHEDRGTNGVEMLKDCVDRIIAAMEFFAPRCRLMTAQLEAVRRAYESVQGEWGNFKSSHAQLQVDTTPPSDRAV